MSKVLKGVIEELGRCLEKSFFGEETSCVKFLGWKYVWCV